MKDDGEKLKDEKTPSIAPRIIQSFNHSIIQLDIERATSAVVGEAHGITPQELEAIEPQILEAHENLCATRQQKEHGFFDLYKDTNALQEIQDLAAEFTRFGYDNLVILGIGGSALGTIALNTALNPPYYNLLDREARQGNPRLFVMDNIDPVTFRTMMDLCPPGRTLYNAISKSGETAETMSQLLIVLAALEQELGRDAVRDHLVVTNSPREAGTPESLLHPVADDYGLNALSIPVNVGGRFSVFSPVGLFPAAMLGMNLDEIAKGCAAMDARCSRAGLLENPAYLRAAMHYVLNVKKGKTMSIMMPYADALRDVADWYRQLWAESLGKRYNRDGDEVFCGQTPIKALGATDQHSQVQLYREGPNDKLITILEVGEFARELRIPDMLHNIPELGYLRGKTMNKLMNAELHATMEVLKDSVRPVIRVTLPQLTPYTVAQLMYMLEVETAMAGELYNINAFDQPGVDMIKEIVRTLMEETG